MKKYIGLLLIILLGLGLRIYPAVRSPGIFAEPDVYIYYSVAKQTMANNMIITSRLSGVPPVPYNEYPGLVLVPAYLSKFTGVSLSLIFEYLPVLMGIFGILVTYMLMYEFMHKEWVANFAAFLYAALPAALYRGMAGEWRGGVFVAVFLGIALLFIIKANKRTAKWAIPGAILFIAISVWFWSGGIYTLIVIGIYIAAMAIFQLLPKAIKKCKDDARMRNRLTYLIILALLPLGYVILSHIPYTAILINDYFSFQTSYISELEPTSISIITVYFGWTFEAAVMGLGLMIYLDSREKFHKEQFAMFALFMPTIIMASMELRWLSLFAIPACIYAAYLVYALAATLRLRRRQIIIALTGLSAIALLLGLYVMLPLRPADSINNGFLQALTWLKANTPANATVLTMWPDGSLVEGYADRESYTDSIMSMDPQAAAAFERFLYQPAGNYTYITSLKPSYMLVRKTWLQELPGILIESGLPLNKSYNGTNMQQFLQVNGTAPPPFPVVFRNNDTIIYRIG